MDIIDGEIYKIEDISKLIAIKNNKILFLNYKVEDNYAVNDILYCNFITSKQFYEQITNYIKQLYLPSIPLKIEINETEKTITINICGDYVEISNILNIDLIKKDDLIDYLKNNWYPECLKELINF
jgi:hypothetical protein